MTTEASPPWWWLVAAPIITGLVFGALWWAAFLVASYYAARAEADHVDDWKDKFWPTVLRGLSKSKYAQVREKWDSEP